MAAQARERGLGTGDFNYGEGISREHAARSPRLLGCVAVIARSFARIHESNLRKQGILALTFRYPTGYERIREGDLISPVDLAVMRPARPVNCRVLHKDATQDALELTHTYSQEQLEWFRASSALNCIRTVVAGRVRRERLRPTRTM